MQTKEPRFSKIISWIILTLWSVLICIIPYNLHTASYLIGAGVFFAGLYRSLHLKEWEGKGSQIRSFAFLFAPMICLYLWDLIGMLYTPCPEVGKGVLERHLSFVAFPLFYILLGPLFFTPKRLKYLMLVFLFSCLGIILSLLGNFFWFVAHNPQVHGYQSFMQYVDLFKVYSERLPYFIKSPWLIHHAYVVWYMITAIVMVVYTWLAYPKAYQRWYVKIGAIILVFLFLVPGILLQYSNMGYVLLAFFTIGLLLYLCWLKKYMLGLGLILFIGLFSFGVYQKIPAMKDRIQKSCQVLEAHFEKETLSFREGSITPRLYLWQTAFAAVCEKPLLGWGTGGEDMAMPKYRVEVEVGTYVGLSPHNQFLSYALRYGLVGLCCFLAVFGMGFWMSYKKRTVLLGTFAGISMISALSEGVMELQIGITFFCLCYGLLMVYTEGKDRGTSLLR